MREREITFVVPVFGNCPGRLANLSFLLSKLCAVSQNVLVVEQVQGSNRSTASTIVQRFNANYLPVEIDDDRIHKSRLINEGTAHCDTPYVWVNDADCYIKYDQVLPSIRLDADFIQPFSVCKRLDKHPSAMLRSGRKVRVTFDGVNWPAPLHTPKQFSLYSGAMFLFRKEAFLRIGGMDENYIGWGCEDTDLCYRVLHDNTASFRCENVKAVHLWHPNSEEVKTGQQLVDRNRNRKYISDKFGLSQIQMANAIKAKYAAMRNTVGIIGIGRTGTSCLAETIRASTAAQYCGEPFGTWGLTKNPSNRHRELYRKDPHGYVETVLSQEPLIKHLDFEVEQSEQKDRLAFQRHATLRLADDRKIIIFTTRYNFLDWLVSQKLSRSEERYRREYTGKQWEISRRQFDHLFAAWKEWHTETLPRLIEMRRAAGKTFHVLDYEQIANPDFLRNFVLKNIPGATAERFRIPTRKQKTKPNESYILNYQEVQQWAAEEGVHYG